MPDLPESARPATGPDSKSGDAMRSAVERELGELSANEMRRPPPPIPDHSVIRHIGSGAYGDVWLARSALGTARAVKVVYRSRFKEDHPYEREFHGILKYEPVSRTHEGLMQVLHVGRNDDVGCFYYVMELADDAGAQSGKQESEKVGASVSPAVSPANFPAFSFAKYSPRTLRSDLARHPRLPPTDAAQLVLRLAGALAHLHAHGLVHRDIKPSNVIFVGGQPKLADIGLVTDLGSSHSFVGTEGFVPPEGPGTARADIYGLGKLLYELATGRDRMDFPQLPPRLHELPDGEVLLDLNEVITRACEPEPQQRYATAKELAADLNLFLGGHSLRTARRIERHLAWLKRAAVVAGVFLVLAAGAVWFARNEKRRAEERAQQSEERARVESALRARAETAERESRQQLYTALVGQSRATVRSGELGQRVRALDALRRAAAISNNVELRREALAAFALPDLRFERELVAGRGWTLAELDPAFERLAFCRGRRPVEIFSVADNRLLASLPASTNLAAYNGLWSSDGRFLAVKRDLDPSGRRGILEVWDVAGARRVLLLPEIPWGTMVFHPRLPWLLVGRRGGGAAIWDVENSRELARLRFDGEPFRLQFAPDGERFAAAYQKGVEWIVSINNSADGVASTSHVFGQFVEGVRWHPNGRWLAVADHSGTVHSMDGQTGEVRALGRHKAQAVFVAFSPDGNYLISGGWERELICWDLQKMQRAFTATLDSYTLQFRGDGRECAVFTRPAQRVQLYSFELPSGHREFSEDLGARVLQAVFSPDGRWLAASGQERLGVWDMTGNGPGVLSDQGAEARLFFTPDGAELFGSCRAYDCSRWRIVPGTNASAPPVLQHVGLKRPGGFTSLCLASNTVAWISSKGSRTTALDQLTTDDGRWMPTETGLSEASADGHWLSVFRPFDRVLHVYRLPGFELAADLTNLSSIASVKFSPPGDELSVASRQHVEFWSTANWQRTRVLTNWIGSMYAPDAGKLWLTKDYRTAGLYDARTLELMLPLPMGMLPLALSPDGRYLAVSADLRRLQVWDLGEMRKQFRELGVDWEDEKTRIQ